MTALENSIEALTQISQHHGPHYVNYLEKTRAGFLREVARLEAEIIREQEEEDLANRDS
jgi:hypothetical protein